MSEVEFNNDSICYCIAAQFIKPDGEKYLNFLQYTNFEASQIELTSVLSKDGMYLDVENVMSTFDAIIEEKLFKNCYDANTVLDIYDDLDELMVLKISFNGTSIVKTFDPNENGLYIIHCECNDGTEVYVSEVIRGDDSCDFEMSTSCQISKACIYNSYNECRNDVNIIRKEYINFTSSHPKDIKSAKISKLTPIDSSLSSSVIKHELPYYVIRLNFVDGNTFLLSNESSGSKFSYEVLGMKHYLYNVDNPDYVRRFESEAKAKSICDYIAKHHESSSYDTVKDMHGEIETIEILECRRKYSSIRMYVF